MPPHFGGYFQYKPASFTSPTRLRQARAAAAQRSAAGPLSKQKRYNGATAGKGELLDALDQCECHPDMRCIKKQNLINYIIYI